MTGELQHWTSWKTSQEQLLRLQLPGTTHHQLPAVHAANSLLHAEHAVAGAHLKLAQLLSLALLMMSSLNGVLGWGKSLAGPAANAVAAAGCQMSLPAHGLQTRVALLLHQDMA